MPTTESEITQLLQEWSAGDPQALDKLMPLVFEEVHDIARRYFARESPGHTLQPTALVHEVYLRLTGIETTQWENRDQFFGFLAGLLRRILVDHARRRQSAKRGGGDRALSLNEDFVPAITRPADLIALDDALDALEGFDPRKRRVVELKFFMGLTDPEIAEALDMSRTTVIRDWASARAWLLRELSRAEEPA